MNSIVNIRVPNVDTWFPRNKYTKDNDNFIINTYSQLRYYNKVSKQQINFNQFFYEFYTFVGLMDSTEGHEFIQAFSTIIWNSLLSTSKLHTISFIKLNVI